MEKKNRLKNISEGNMVQCYTIDSFAGRLNQLVRENTGLKFQTNTYEENMIYILCNGNKHPNNTCFKRIFKPRFSKVYIKFIR